MLCLQGAFFDDNKISTIRLDSDVRQLRVLSAPRNQLSGPVYSKLSQALSMIALHLQGNSFTSLPRSWDGGVQGFTLEVMDVSDNALEVRCVHSGMQRTVQVPAEIA